MRIHARLVLASALLVLAGCGDPGFSPGATTSGVTGVVHVGPQCPAENVNTPCPDRPAAKVTMTVSAAVPAGRYAMGKLVGRATTDADGRFRIGLAAGAYRLTANAGMSCRPIDIRVEPASYVSVDLRCDSGIR